MKFKQIVLFAIVFVFAACNKEAQQPNIIVLLVDDAGYADFCFAGSQDLETPNIDALVADGVVFTDAHVSATVCGPSRAGLITGRYQQRFGFECNPNGHEGIDLSEPTLAEAMKSAGYATAAFGKWHLGSEDGYKPNARGFDYYWGFLSGSRGYFPTEKEDATLNNRCIRENDSHVQFEGYLTDALGLKAVDYIDQHSDEPFFIYWAPNAVHTPMQAPSEDLARYKDHPRQKLAAMTWALDRSVGLIINKLKSEGIYDNTLIFFLSDNGGAHNNQSSNYPLKGFKGNKYEGGHRVAFAVTYPTELSPGVFHGLTSSLDIFATSIEVAGIPNYRKNGKQTDGVNLLPFLKGETLGHPHQELYWRKDKMAAARLGDYKLIRVENLGYRFYDLSKNLYEDKDIKNLEIETFSEANEKLKTWEKQLLDPLWTEGAVWDTITYLIHEDYFNNSVPKVRSSSELKTFYQK